MKKRMKLKNRKDKVNRIKLSLRRKRRRNKKYNIKLFKDSKMLLRTFKKTYPTKQSSTSSLKKSPKHLKNLKNCLQDTKVKKQERDY